MLQGLFFSFSHKYNLCGDRRKIIIYGDCPRAVCGCERGLRFKAGHRLRVQHRHREMTVSVENDGDLLRPSPETC